MQKAPLSLESFIITAVELLLSILKNLYSFDILIFLIASFQCSKSGFMVKLNEELLYPT